MNTASSAEGHQERDQSGSAARSSDEFVEQLRSAPAEEIVAETFLMLLNAAQIKLGRRDARLFIDLSTVILDHAGKYLSGGLVTQVQQSLSQLRLGQVTAENEVAKKGQPEPNDLPRAPTPPTTSSGQPSSAGAQSPASRLWVPGR